jgi:hypothetical protein
VLVAYLGEDEVDAWLDAVSDPVATRRMSRRRSDAADAKDMSGAA